MSDDGVLHFNPWMDFNDGPPSENPFGCDPDPDQIAIFLDTVFSWCEGLIPLRGFVDKGQGRDGKPHNIWIPADDTAPDKLATFAAWAIDVGQKLLEAGAVQRPARDAAVVILIADQHPTLGALAGDIRLAGLSLGVERVELLLQPFLGRLARVDGAALAADGICALLHQSFPRFRSRNPKKR
jgi:hypothetical protein